MMAMMVPVLLFLGQLSQWYQSRPLSVGEEALVTLKLNGSPESSWPEVYLQPASAYDIALGPVRVQSNREICWNIKACANGYHHLAFQVNGEIIDKELAIGAGFMRV